MKPCGLRALRGELDLLERRVGLRVGDVLGDGGAEQEGVVGDEGDLRAQRGEVDVAQVGAVDRDRSRGRVVEAGEQADQAGLARAGRADQRDDAAGLDLEVDVAERRPRCRRRRGRRRRGGRARGRRAAAGRRAWLAIAGSRSRISNSRLPEAIARWDMPSAVPSIRIGPISMIR